MKAITIYPVWAWAIVHGHKRVENRSWKMKHRGPMLIHASGDSPAARKSNAVARAALAAIGVEVPDEVPTGALVGIVEVTAVLARQLVFHGRYLENFDPPASVDLVQLAADPLATGPYCWTLERPLIFRPAIPYKGRQGLYEVDSEVISREMVS